MASEIEAAVAAIKRAVEDAGVADVISQYPAGGKKRHTRPVIVLGVGGAKVESCGFAEYLGLCLDSESGTYSELYGKRCDMTLAVKIYSPGGEMSGEEMCFGVFSRLVESLGALPYGIKLRSIEASGTRYDGDVSMFELEAEMKLTVCCRGRSEDGTEFTDFYIKGVLI